MEWKALNQHKTCRYDGPSTLMGVWEVWLALPRSALDGTMDLGEALYPG